MTVVPDDLVTALGDLGLTPNEARIYLALLDDAPLTAAEVADRSGVPRSKVYGALRGLEHRGFCVATGGAVATFVPVDAGLALNEWTRRREHDRRLETDREQRTVRALIERLPQPPERGPVSAADLMAAMVGRDATLDAYREMISTTVKRIDIVQAAPVLQDAGELGTVELAAVQRSVRVRMLCTPDVISTVHGYGELLAAGGEVRVSDKLPFKIVVRDEEEAMVALPGAAADIELFTSVRIRHPDLVAPLHLLFQREWRRARPVVADAAPKPATTREKRR